MIYLWLKALHVFSVIAFMAGMFYLPRLFVYHSLAEKGSAQSETFKIMERRLDLGIMRPSLVLVLASGIGLGFGGHWFAAGWLDLKLLLVLLMIVVYVYLVRLRYRFAADVNLHSPRYFRILNEIPTLLLIGIVILAVVKPL
ncbi:MAG TPA: CopD family protein [Methylovirgula sp.]|nr:CopD family protein [Methylovirgula sp.]